MKLLVLVCAATVGFLGIPLSGQTRSPIHPSSSLTEIWSVEAGGRIVLTVAFSPDGSRIASGSSSNELTVWSQSGTKIWQGSVQGARGGFQDLAFSPDGSRIISASRDEDLRTEPIRIWDAYTGAEVRSSLGNLRGWFCYGVTYSSDGALITTACLKPSNRGNVEFSLSSWDARSWQLRWRNTEAEHPLAYSPDGRMLISGNAHARGMRSFDPGTGHELSRLFENISPRAVAFSPDSRRIATGEATNKKLMLWDSQTGAAVFTATGHTDYVEDVAFSPDGSRIATASRDGTLRVWDAASGAQVSLFRAKVPCHDATGSSSRTKRCDWFSSVAFSPDGSHIVAGGREDNRGSVVLLSTGYQGQPQYQARPSGQPVYGGQPPGQPQYPAQPPPRQQDWGGTNRGHTPTVNLNGQWQAQFTCPAGIRQWETVTITQQGQQIEATKVTGDPCVPAGLKAFQGSFSGTSGQLFCAVGSPQNPASQWVPGTLRVIDANSFEACTMLFAR